MISTGAIGYVTERTLDTVLGELGKNAPGEFGPLAVVTVLRMFELEPIRGVFERHGLAFDTVPGVRLPQRRFTDTKERREVLSVLHEKGIDTKGWEDQGKHFADLFVAAPSGQLPDLMDRMISARSEHEESSSPAGYIRR